MNQPAPKPAAPVRWPDTLTAAQFDALCDRLCIDVLVDHLQSLPVEQDENEKVEDPNVTVSHV